MSLSRRLRRAPGLFALLGLAALLVACQPASLAGSAPASTAIAVAEAAGAVSVAEEAASAPEPATPTPQPTATITPTPTVTPLPTPTATPTPTPSPTPIGPCPSRVPDDGLLTLVTMEYGLSPNYEPDDLVLLSDYVDTTITLGYPTTVRSIVIDPLMRMIADMQADGLAPFIISGYRSHAQQITAREKWLLRYPDRVNILSAPPGHSEHQLGTTVDFGSPELPELVGDPDIEFHTHFYLTSEGQWLAANAHRYGFTLSYPRQAQETTGFFYEPWHYRFVGVELATMLKEQGLYLIEYLLADTPPPCIP